MNTGMLLEMAADGMGERVALGTRHGGLTFAGLLDQARRVASVVAESGPARLVSVGRNSALLPALLFGGGLSGVPFVPVNYRLADEQLRAILSRTAPAVAVVDDDAVDRVAGVDGLTVLSPAALRARVEAATPAEAGFVDPDEIAVLLYTSGTTGKPKAAVLRHRHLASYVISTVEFMGATDDHAALVSVPPYHVAGMATILTSVYGGRRLVYLPQFDPQRWVDVARDEGITHAMVVPTMLGRILDVLEARNEKLPSLLHLAYGGGRMPTPVLERALALLPAVGFVNAYGLTETASTIATLGPDDHRAAFESADPAIRARLGSVGRPLPSLDQDFLDRGAALTRPRESVSGHETRDAAAQHSDAPAGPFRTGPLKSQTWEHGEASSIQATPRRTVGSRQSAVSRKPDARNQKSEVRSRKSGDRRSFTLTTRGELQIKA